MIEVLFDGAAEDASQGTLVRRAMAAAFAREGRAGDASILLTTGDVIRQLNRDFRHIDRVTDVLTFPAWEGGDSVEDGYLGDVAICVERAAEQAEEYGHSLERELAFLSVHGALHLMGYDHMTPEEEESMTSRQTEILNEMGLTR